MAGWTCLWDTGQKNIKKNNPVAFSIYLLAPGFLYRMLLQHVAVIWLNSTAFRKIHQITIIQKIVKMFDPVYVVNAAFQRQSQSVLVHNLKKDKK